MSLPNSVTGSVYCDMYMRDQDTVVRGSDPYGTFRWQQRVIHVTYDLQLLEFMINEAHRRKSTVIPMTLYSFHPDVNHGHGNRVLVNINLIEHIVERKRG